MSGFDYFDSNAITTATAIKDNVTGAIYTIENLLNGEPISKDGTELESVAELKFGSTYLDEKDVITTKRNVIYNFPTLTIIPPNQVRVQNLTGRMYINNIEYQISIEDETFTATVNTQQISSLIVNKDNIISQSFIFTDGGVSKLLRNSFILATLSHQNLTTLDAIFPLHVQHASNYNSHYDFNDFMRFTYQNAVSIEGINPYPITVRKFGLTAGKTFALATNYMVDEQNPNLKDYLIKPPASITNLLTVYKTGPLANQFAIVPINMATTEIPNSYNNTTTYTLDPMTAALKVTVHRVYYSIRANIVLLVYGQNIYANIDAARNAIASELVDLNISGIEAFNLRGYVIPTYNSTNWTLSGECVFLNWNYSLLTASGSVYQPNDHCALINLEYEKSCHVNFQKKTTSGILPVSPTAVPYYYGQTHLDNTLTAYLDPALHFVSELADPFNIGFAKIISTNLASGRTEIKGNLLNITPSSSTAITTPLLEITNSNKFEIVATNSSKLQTSDSLVIQSPVIDQIGGLRSYQLQGNVWYRMIDYTGLSAKSVKLLTKKVRTSPFTIGETKITISFYSTFNNFTQTIRGTALRTTADIVEVRFAYETVDPSHRVVYVRSLGTVSSVKIDMIDGLVATNIKGLSETRGTGADPDDWSSFTLIRSSLTGSNETYQLGSTIYINNPAIANQNLMLEYDHITNTTTNFTYDHSGRAVAVNAGAHTLTAPVIVQSSTNSIDSSAANNVTLTSTTGKILQSIKHVGNSNTDLSVDGTTSYHINNCHFQTSVKEYTVPANTANYTTGMNMSFNVPYNSVPFIQFSISSASSLHANLSIVELNTSRTTQVVYFSATNLDPVTDITFQINLLGIGIST